MLVETYADPFTLIVTTSALGGAVAGGLVEASFVVGTAAALETNGLMGMILGSLVGGALGVGEAKQIIAKFK